MKKWIRILIVWFKGLPILSQIIDWSKRYVLPGFSGVPVYYVIRFIIQETQKDNLTTRANSVAYSFFLSIFPAIIFIFTLLPYLPFTADYTQLASDTLERVLPENVHQYLMGIVYDITSIKRQGLLSIGILLAVFFSSSGMLTLMYGFDKSYSTTFKRRGYFYKYWIALLLTFTLILLLMGSITLFLSGNYLLSLANITAESTGITGFIIKLLKNLLIFCFVYLGVSLIYKHGPSLKKKTALINPGSLLTTILLISASFLFSYFINNFGRYNEIYGSIGALIAFMVYLQITAFILLVGFELNASIAVNRDLMEENEDDFF